MKLTDKYTQENGAVYMTGIQALVRLPIDQMRRDRAAGLKTATFISGYEGSPLGGYDMALQRAGRLLTDEGIHFFPGMNEDLAGTAILGSQMLHTLGPSKYDGILGIWYGKGPGVDRSGDILRHANIIGSPGKSAALVLAGDDHLCKSSTIPHQSDLSLYNFGIPFLFPGNTQEVLDYGLKAIALSRFTGAWCGMKLVTNVCDAGGTVVIDPHRLDFLTSEAQRPPSAAANSPGTLDPHLPRTGPFCASSLEGYEKKTDTRLWAPPTLMMEYEVNVRRQDAAREFAHRNQFDRWYGAQDNAWLGIATAGKAYYDLLQALRDLGISEHDLASHGIRIAKYAMIFPLDDRFTRDFARGLRQILVIEEKRSFLELQMRDVLYNIQDRPLIIGKRDQSGAPLLPASAELDPDILARVLAPLLRTQIPLDSITNRIARLEAVASKPKELVPPRPPNFCSGCPHNRSTILLEGQIAGGGIGCHGMGAMLTDSNRGYLFSTHMGAEGVPWIGMAPFTDRKHIFQNIGDGTYAHSGSLAIQAAVAAGVNITYKILYNGHVAMTGGQTAVGQLPIPDLTRKLEAEGVKRTVVLAEDPAKYFDAPGIAPNAVVRDRIELTATLAELEKISGVTVIIYDQQCAAEKRRMRSRGRLAEPTKRLVINEEVCEGCGDCVKQSNCMSLQPIATELGQKIRIHQSSCNKDYSCALGDCPSFVTIQIEQGSGLKRRKLPDLPLAEVPPPRDTVKAGDGYRVLMPGIGGTGVVTINALLATAGLLDGLSVLTLDQTGLAQKGGAVVSHLVFSEKPIAVSAKTNTANADLVLAFDLLGAAGSENLKTMDASRTIAVLNTNVQPTGESIRKRAALSGPERLLDILRANTQHGRNLYIDAARLAEALFGSHLMVNIFLVGVAFQAGLLPVSENALLEAIRLNGVDVERNQLALQWGRKYYQDAAFVENAIGTPTAAAPMRTLDRAAELTKYQNEAYARDYQQFVDKVAQKAPALKDTVAANLYKLMAYKDEYEVARLLTKPDLESQMLGLWAKPLELRYNLHPPLLRALGMKRKLDLGPWFKTPLRLLASLKFLRGTPLDPFGYMSHRREERALITWYRSLIEEVLALYTPETEPAAQELAALPDQIRGYEQIKSQSIQKVKSQAQEKLQALQNPVTRVS